VRNENVILNPSSNKWFAFIGITLLSFGCYLDYTIVNIALPTIQQELQTNLTSLQWVMNIYFLALCILATIMGRCGDLYGRRRCFYWGVIIFIIASVIAGLASNIGWLIFGRLIQGIGAAIVFPLGPSLLPESFPVKERGKAIAWLGSTGGVALALGPVLGGVILTHWGWRWIFFINVPIALIGFLFCYKSVKESVVVQINSSLDWKGMLLLALTMGGIVLSLIHSQNSGWKDPITLGFLATGFIACLCLIKVERNQKDPLIDINDFSNILFYAGAVLCFLAGVLSAVALFFDPLYLQIIRGQSAQLSGLVLFIIPVAVFGVAFLVNGLINYLGIVNTILFALFIAAISGLLQIFFTSNTPLYYVALSFACLGIMWAMGNTVSIIAAQTAVGSSRHSVATGTMVTMFNMGGSIGLAAAVVIYNFVTSQSLNTIFNAPQQVLNMAQYQVLKNLISNPAESLQTSMSSGVHHFFNVAFMEGFAGTMFFLLILSSVFLASVLLWKIRVRFVK